MIIDFFYIDSQTEFFYISSVVNVKNIYEQLQGFNGHF